MGVGRGGKRAGAGRKTGSRTKATALAKEALEALARKHTSTALKALVDVASDAESGASRVAAAVALLDRGYGRPHQTQDTNLSMGISQAFADLLRAVNEQRSRSANIGNGHDPDAVVRH